MNNFEVFVNEEQVVSALLPHVAYSADSRESIAIVARQLIDGIRKTKCTGIEEFMQQFSLSTDEGIAIMCLAEGLLRIPDQNVASELVIDKLSNKDWYYYLKKSKSFGSGLTACGLYVSGKIADIACIDNIVTNLVTRIGQPIFLQILKKAITFLGNEFVFGQDVKSAIANTNNYSKYRFAFDLLGESARTFAQAEQYYEQYCDAINKMSAANMAIGSDNLWTRPNLSVKLTALYPRFEFTKKQDIDDYLLPKLVELVQKVKANNLTITFDAEEARRFDIYFYTLTQLIQNPHLRDFAGIGFVMQAYQTRAYNALDDIINLAKSVNHIIPVRLVKGAYWDLEIKYAQENGLRAYPVFTNRIYTEASYVACARKMLANDKYIFSQFATHNSLTAAIIQDIAANKEFEFQKLHGMGNSLHEALIKDYDVRIYAPIGHMNALLAYLMRRILENGANTCFVNQVHNINIPPEQLIYDIHAQAKSLLESKKESIILPKNIYQSRENPRGYDLGYAPDNNFIHQVIRCFYDRTYEVGSVINSCPNYDKTQKIECYSPGQTLKKVADVFIASKDEIALAVSSLFDGFYEWSKYDVKQRSDILRKIADLYEENKFHLYALLMIESGKTFKDAMNEVIEAIDFCRYYAHQAEILFTPTIMPGITGESNILQLYPKGNFLCISPWNFPLAIFTGQIVAALVCGNSVIAKAAAQSSVISYIAVNLMHKAGVPKCALQLVIASGKDINQYIVASNAISGVAFTGSNDTAKIINTTLATRNNSAIAAFIAETGGQNVMIVDSSALLEQVTDDILSSAFGSAGQRCSALRMLYVQEEIYDVLLEMIVGAMSTLKVGDSFDFATDIGPVIDNKAFDVLSSHIQRMQSNGFNVIMHPQNTSDNSGYFFFPYIIEVSSINDIDGEKFGPILHIAKYKNEKLDDIIDEINNYGFGLTFGLHSRIERKIEYITSKIHAGNIYINRSMIGAKVESQPFGGENKSGTGFKAGGPNYLLRFTTERTITLNLTAVGGNVELLNKKVDIIN